MEVFDSWRIRWIWMEADDSSQIVDLWECWGRADPLLGDVTTIRSWLGDTNADAMQLNTPTTTVQRDTNNSLDQYCAEGYQRYYLASLLCWIPIPVPAIQHLAWLGDTNADAILNTSTIFYQLCAPGYQQLFTDTKFVQLNTSCSLAVLMPAILIPYS